MQMKKSKVAESGLERAMETVPSRCFRPVLLVRSKAHVTARIIDAAPNLKVIGRASATADHIDLRAARRRNIHVVYAPQVAVSSTAEFTLAMIMALHRRLLFFDRQIREGQFDALRTPAGREMSRETLALWGLDPIAERLGVLCTAAFGRVIKGMTVVRAIQQAPVMGQNLYPTIPILRIRRR